MRRPSPQWSPVISIPSEKPPKIKPLFLKKLAQAIKALETEVGIAVRGDKSRIRGDSRTGLERTPPASAATRRGSASWWGESRQFGRRRPIAPLIDRSSIMLMDWSRTERSVKGILEMDCGFWFLESFRVAIWGRKREEGMRDSGPQYGV